MRQKAPATWPRIKSVCLHGINLGSATSLRSKSLVCQEFLRILRKFPSVKRVRHKSAFEPQWIRPTTKLTIHLLFPALFMMGTAWSHGQVGQQDSLLQLLENVDPTDYSYRASILNQLSLLLHAREPAVAQQYAEEVISFGHALKDKGHLATAYNSKGMAQIIQSNYEDALASLAESLEMNLALKHREAMAGNYVNLGVAFQHLNHYTQALENYQQAALLFRETDDVKEIYLYNNMSALYAEQKNYEKALEYLELVRAGSVAHSNRALEAAALTNNGALLIENGRHREAVQHLDSALAIGVALGDPSGVGRAHGNLGSAYHELGDFERATTHFQQAIAINKELSNQRSMAINEVGLGGNYLSLGRPGEAYVHLTEAKRLARELHLLSVQRDAAQHLSTLHEQRGLKDSALTYYREYTILKDSISNEENRKEFTRLELQYEFGLKEQDFLRQQTLSELKLRQVRLYGILAITALVALAIFLLQHMRLRSLRSSARMKEQELHQKAETLLMQQRLNESELKAIRSQMNPHFIFNVLNSIESYVMENDAQAASRLVQQFARLTRRVLENSTHSAVPLEKEWDALQLYVKLEATRCGHCFDYEFVSDPSIEKTPPMIPPMLIQPLVENAIHHGLRPQRQYRGKLEVRASCNDDQLVVTVSDNGIGRKLAAKMATGSPFKERSMGIAGIEDRLKIMKENHPGTEAALRYIDDAKDWSTTAMLVFPLLIVQVHDPVPILPRCPA